MMLILSPPEQEEEGGPHSLLCQPAVEVALMHQGGRGCGRARIWCMIMAVVPMWVAGGARGASSTIAAFLAGSPRSPSCGSSTVVRGISRRTITTTTTCIPASLEEDGTATSTDLTEAPKPKRKRTVKKKTDTDDPTSVLPTVPR